MLRLLLIGFLTGVAAPAFASFGDESPGVGLAAQLFCETFTITSGTLGLLVGFAIALYGLWKIIGSSSLQAGLTLIIVGAMLTALPSVIRATMGGLSEFLTAMNISNTSIVSGINYALQFQGQCEQIPVDWSYFDDTNPTYTQSPGVGADGKALPSPRQRGVAGSGNYGRGRATKGGVSEADLKGGRKAPGCTERVEGGTVGDRGFGMQWHPIDQRYKMHTGTDIRCGGRSGPKISHKGGGTIQKAEWTGGYGNRVEVKMGDGSLKTYSHLNAFGPGVKVGATASELIGYCGSTGKSTGPHLHFEIMKSDGNYTDPVAAGC